VLAQTLPVSAWYADHACAASELSTDIPRLCATSEVLSETCDQATVAAQQLHSFSRGSVGIKAGAWVQVESATAPGESYICRISEMVQVFTHEAWHIRMLACECIPTPSASGGVWMHILPHQMVGKRMIVDAESVHISELHAVRDGASFWFRYVW